MPYSRPTPRHVRLILGMQTRPIVGDASGVAFSNSETFRGRNFNFYGEDHEILKLLRSCGNRCCVVDSLWVWRFCDYSE